MKQEIEHHHLILAIVGFLVVAVLAGSGDFSGAGTQVPGHAKDNSGRLDADNNGYPDVGISVNGHYTSIYAYDDNGDYYWDLGDGRVQGTVDSIDDLDQDTFTQCDYVVNYRGGFNNDPFMDFGWIQNIISCSGYDDNNHYNYFIVHNTDPRFTNNPEWSIWGTWEYQGLTQSKLGNLVKVSPRSHQGN